MYSQRIGKSAQLAVTKIHK
uniref:Uncharacterized protein n=1 Tax=Arundo donax TaxID=35708 RepID=A0A0A8Z8Q7_ARUDO